MERSNNYFRISPLIPITCEIKKAHGINLNSMAGQRISTYAYSVNIFSACICRIRIFCKICRVVLSIYLQNAHMSVIRFDLFSQDMIFTLSTFERGNLYAHLK